MEELLLANFHYIICHLICYCSEDKQKSALVFVKVYTLYVIAVDMENVSMLLKTIELCNNK